MHPPLLAMAPTSTALRHVSTSGDFVQQQQQQRSRPIQPSSPHPMYVYMFSYCGAIRCSESLGSSGQVLVAQYLGLARDSRKASGVDAEAPWVGDAQEFRNTARSIAKRVLTLSLGLGLGLAASSMAIFPVLLAVVCRSAEVAALVSQV